jgi:alpha/beta superfamily hydrolase
MRRAIVILLLIAAACGDDGTSPNTTGATTSIAATTSTVAPPATAAPDRYRPTELTTADGLTLEARVYPGSSTWVVLGHMRPADMSSWSRVAEALQDAGHSVLIYNNRGYGESDGDRQPFNLGVDAEAALALARSQGAGVIVYGGASMNGATAIYLGATQDLAGIFTLSGVPQMPSLGGVDGYLADITEPHLFIAAEDDGLAASDARHFYDSSSEPREILIYESGGHGTDMLAANPDLEDVILGFVAEVT